MAAGAEPPTKTCPSCASTDTVFVQRGFAGSTDENDQYFTCRACGLVTYEIVARSERDLRIHRLEPGRRYVHAGWEYTVSRVLKIGVNESLVYLKPTVRER